MSMSSEEKAEFGKLKWDVAKVEREIYGYIIPGSGIKSNVEELIKKVDLILSHLGLTYIPEHKCGPELKPTGEK